MENSTNQNVITDWREPDVIRCAPVPFYNSYEDVFRMVEILKNPTAMKQKEHILIIGAGLCGSLLHYALVSGATKCM